ncbi:MAG: metallophosphatase family protein [Oscillospiraceae bacterium]|nr:metallophosphatase family protein [Oscillospiraceae bacterium]
MIFITGDIHGEYDIHKFSTKKFPMQKLLSRSDYMIICGDFGLLWDGSNSERWWLNWLEKKPWTTLFIDGNHENFDMLESYPLTEWNKTQVHQITEHIIHLCRGSVFELEGKRFFAFGGAESHDKTFRKKGISIWEQEMPNAREMQYGREVLKKMNWQTDIVITHSLPQRLQEKIFKADDDDYKSNALTNYFDEIDTKLDFKFWFSGHYHISTSYHHKYFLVYHDILQLTDNGFTCVYSQMN